MRNLIYLVYIFLMVQVFGAQQTINIGATANDGTGDTLRGAFVKVNENFTDIYSQLISPTGIINLYGQGRITNAVAIGSSAYYIGYSNVLDVIRDAVADAGADLSGVNDYLGTGTITNLLAIGTTGNGYIGGNLTVATNVTVGGVTEIADGAYNSPSLKFSGGNKAGLYFQNGQTGYTGDGFGPTFNGTVPFWFGNATAGGHSLIVSSSGSFGFGKLNQIQNPDTFLRRDGAGTLALRNGTNPQEFRFYSTYTDASNYERGSLQADAGVVTLAAESSGTGSADMDLAFKVNGNGAIYAESASGVAGNARGSGAIDLQVYRTAATQVASGVASFQAGIGNTTTAVYGVSLGSANDTSGPYSVSAGSYNVASAFYTLATGRQSSAYLTGQQSFASGFFSAAGDAQGSRLVMRNTTSGTTPADLFLDGSSARAVLPANTSWKFTVEVTGRATDAGSGAEEVASYEFKGTITRDGANNTSFPWPVTKTVEGESDATWDVTVSADDTNEALNISCTGGSGDNVRWVAVINLVEVGG